MSRDRLPSITSLRVFLALAEHETTLQAASVVGLTQSAVSKQIRSLEETLGMALFERSSRGLTLTEAGTIYRPYVEASLEQLTRARRRLGERADARRPVRLHMLAIVGERWLMARFPGFTAMHPEIDVQFTHYVTETASEEPDIDIRHGDGGWPDMDAHYLFGREMVLVAAPALIERAGGLASAADVQTMTLLQHFQMPAYWAEFTEAHGQRGAVPAHTIRYGYLSVIIRAAVAGLGIALLPRCFVTEELSSGALVAPEGLTFTSATGYWLTRPRSGDPRGEVNVLAEWLIAEAADFRGEDQRSVA
ncbi:MAG: LysR substrate-binding domain-containing protein [Alphaproteobacteria bacterium]